MEPFRFFSAVLASISFFLAPGALAEVVRASDTGFVLEHEVKTAMVPELLWKRLVDPASWWASAHTYSGDARNLSFKAEAGGLWREDWEAGSVLHGTALTVIEGKLLVLSAPFGPLQGTGAECIWTISLEADGEEGTLIRSRHVIAGSPETGLEALAPAVDQVIGQGLARLAGPQ